MFAHGWYCVAFESELSEPLTPIAFGERRLMICRTEAGIAVYDADCPHRGAHLAVGGRLEGQHVVCPFHGYRVRLGESSEGFCVRQYETLCMGGNIFVRLSGQRDNGWRALLETLEAEHRFVPALTLPLKASIEMVIENGFDRRHFEAVHSINIQPFDLRSDATGALIVESQLAVSQVRRGTVNEVSYKATTISPGLIIVQLGGPQPYGIITGAIPVSPTSCVARLSFVIPKNANGGRPDVDALVEYSRKGLADDDRVWGHLSRRAPQNLLAEDWPIRRFYDFCRSFEGPV
jgi:phenylpropionate dioxygenase-like ring-hydroxylating dioxygenase large terminal subunit